MFVKFHKPNPIRLLLTVIKRDAKHRFRAAAILLFHILQKVTLLKVYISKIDYHK